MKNRLFALLLVVALVVTVSVFAVGAEETNPFAGRTTKFTAHCAHCDREVVWAPVPTASSGQQRAWLDAEIADGTTTYYSQGITHFYLQADSTLGSAQNANADETWCFDLNGFTWTRTSWVFFNGQGGTINVFDSSADKTGTCVQTGTANTTDTVMQMDGGTFDQYGGNFVHNQSAWAGNGAVAIIKGGTYNMYGGTMNGQTTKYGGAVCITNGVFNLVDGTITGYATQGGGGIYVHGGTVNMTGGKLLDCRTTETITHEDIAYPYTTSDTYGTGRGGAMYIDAGTVTISNVEITNAKASYGGAIVVTTVSDTVKPTVTISGGTIEGKAGTMGGAIAVYGGKWWYSADGKTNWQKPSYAAKPTLTISGGTITGEAPWGGGGIYIDNGGTVNMQGGTLLDCETTTTNTHWDSADKFSATAPTSYGKGGGVLVMNGTFNMSAGKISACRGSYGGGIFIASNTASGIANISGTAVIENCWANTRAGGVGVVQGKYWSNATGSWKSVPYEARGQLTITGGEFKNNTVNAANSGNGGAIFVYTALDVSISDATITGSNDPNNKNAYQGAAIYVGPDSSLTLTDVTMTNMAGSQGTIFMNGENDTRKAVLDITNCVIDGSKMTDNCSGIMANAYADLNWTNNTIQNSYSSWTGGALYLNKTTTTNINGGLIKNCWINTTSPGAGLYMDAAANVESVVGLTIEGCKAAGSNGGNVYVSAGQTVTFEDCKFIGTGDAAQSQAICGGNVYVNTDANVTFNGCEFKNGVAMYGGSVYIVNATVRFNDCNFSGGIATANGGNLYVYGAKADVTVDGNSAITDGSAVSRGSNIGIDGAKLTLTGHTEVGGKDTVAAGYMGSNITVFGNAAALHLSGNVVVKEAPLDKLTQSYTVTQSISIETTCTITLDGNVNVDDIVVRYSQADPSDNKTDGLGTLADNTVTIKSGFEGKVSINLYQGSNMAAHTPGAEIAGWLAQKAGYENTGDIRVFDAGWTSHPVVDTGDKFVIASFGGVKDGVETGLVAMPEGGDYDYVNLYVGGNIILNGDTTVRLNGQIANFSTGIYKLSVFDTATDAFDKAGTTFAVDNAANLVKVVENASNGYKYVVVGNEDDGFTSNRILVKLTGIAVRPNNAGMYYVTTVQTNAGVKGYIKSFGTALTLIPEVEINENFQDDKSIMYTQINDGDKLTVDDSDNINAKVNSVLIAGILDTEKYTPEQNKEWAAKPIKARSYIEIDIMGDDEEVVCIMGENVEAKSLNDAMELMDAQFDKLGNKQGNAVDFYRDWQTVFEDLDLPNLKTAVDAEAA